MLGQRCFANAAGATQQYIAALANKIQSEQLFAVRLLYTTRMSPIETGAGLLNRRNYPSLDHAQEVGASRGCGMTANLRQDAIGIS